MISNREANILGLSIKVILIIAIVMMLFGVYIGVLLYGENSLSVLNELKRTERRLSEEAKELKSEKQRLQKESFELIQLAKWEE